MLLHNRTLVFARTTLCFTRLSLASEDQESFFVQLTLFVLFFFEHAGELSAIALEFCYIFPCSF